MLSKKDTARNAPTNHMLKLKIQLLHQRKSEESRRRRRKKKRKKKKKMLIRIRRKRVKRRRRSTMSRISESNSKNLQGTSKSLPKATHRVFGTKITTRSVRRPSAQAQLLTLSETPNNPRPEKQKKKMEMPLLPRPA